MKKLIYFIIAITCCISCNSNNKSKNIANKINVFNDSILIKKDDIEGLDSFNFRCYSTSFNINSDSSLSLLYLVDSSSIIDYNISKNTIYKQRLIGKNPIQTGFISINKMKGHYSLLNALSGLFIYNTDSLIPESFQELNSIKPFNNNNIVLSSDLGFNYKLPIIGDSSILFNVIDFKKRKVTFATRNLYTHKSDFYKFRINELMYKKFHPVRNAMRMELVGDTLFVSYQFTEMVDLFSIDKKKFLGSVEMKSKYQSQEIPYLKSNKDDFENERYPIEADYYDGLTYNPYKKCFYRLYYHQLPRFNKNDEYTIKDEKKLSIAIFDMNFNWVGEEIVLTKDFFSGVVPHPDGALSFWATQSKGNFYQKIVKHN